MYENFIMIFSEGALVELKVVEAKRVNISEMNKYLNTFLGLTALAILAVNLLLIRIIRKSSKTFVNLLVLMDCFISLGHLLILLQYIL